MDPYTQMNRAPQQRSRETVRFILDATDRIREQNGTAEVTMKRVARVAGVGVGTLYHHFPDRDALLRQAERRAWTAEFEQLVAHIPPLRPDTIDAAVPALVHFAVASIQRRIEAVGVTMDDESVRAAMFELWDDAARILACALAPMAERFRRPDLLESLRLAIETLSLISWVGALRHPDRIASGELPRELGDMLARYLLTDPPAGAVPK